MAVVWPDDAARDNELRFVVTAYRRDLAEILAAMTELRDNVDNTLTDAKTIPLADARSMHDALREISVVLGQTVLVVAACTDGWSVSVPENDTHLRMMRAIETAAAFIQPTPEMFSDITTMHADALDDALDVVLTAVGRYRRSLVKIRTDRPDGGRIAQPDDANRPDDN